MSLTGNLGVFPLEDVLRMLSQSQKSGCLRVEASGVHGRVFLQTGKLSLATTSTDDELRRQLIAAGIVDDAQFRRVELSGAVLSDVVGDEQASSKFAEFVREHVVESVHRMRRPQAGTFDFHIDSAPRYPTGQSYEMDVILSEADRRGHEWDDIERVLPDGTVPLAMVAELPDDEAVTLSPQTWRILAALGAGTSTVGVADRLGMSAFWTSREMAGLVRNGLVGEAPGPATTELAEPEPEALVVSPVEGESQVDEESQVAEASEDSWTAAPEPVDSGDSVEAAPVGSDERLEAVPVASGEPTEELPVQSDPGVDEMGWPIVGDDAEVPASAEEPVLEDSTGPQAAAADQPEVTAPEEDEAAPVADSPWARLAEAPESTESEAESSPWQRSTWEEAAPATEAEDADDGATGESWTEWGVIDGEDDIEQPVVEPVEAGPEGEDQHADDEGWWTPGEDAGGAQATDAEADRFLESVFSSLSEDESENEESEDETGFGLGLLRRRRMNAAARDISENDS